MLAFKQAFERAQQRKSSKELSDVVNALIQSPKISAQTAGEIFKWALINRGKISS